MLGFVKMLGRVLILGRVATAHVTANEAHTQVDPCIAGLHAVLTHMFVGFFYFDLIKMGAFFGHRFLLGRSMFSSRYFLIPLASSLSNALFSRATLVLGSRNQVTDSVLTTRSE